MMEKDKTAEQLLDEYFALEFNPYLSAGAIFDLQSKVTEITERGFRFKNDMLASYAVRKGSARTPKNRKVLNTVGGAWKGEHNFTIANLIIPSYLPPGTTRIDTERDADTIAAVIGHFTPAALVRGSSDDKPICEECSKSPWGRSKDGLVVGRYMGACHQVAMPASKRDEMPCTECIIWGRTCSLAPPTNGPAREVTSGDGVGSPSRGDTTSRLPTMVSQDEPLLSSKVASTDLEAENLGISAAHSSRLKVEDLTAEDATVKDVTTEDAKSEPGATSHIDYAGEGTTPVDTWSDYTEPVLETNTRIPSIFDHIDQSDAEPLPIEATLSPLLPGAASRETAPNTFAVLPGAGVLGGSLGASGGDTTTSPTTPSPAQVAPTFNSFEDWASYQRGGSSKRYRLDGDLVVPESSQSSTKKRRK
ncbi:hypothetical protein HBI70_165600 [Parastagonospora nodorum]|nr:hypothetical protein HBH95_142820 [Parastagonospora nodorum]KAH5260584.1 hypothetical protein HBI70_165600 [Parastagonospora nodorum]